MDPEDVIHFSRGATTCIEVEQKLHRDWMETHQGEQFSRASELGPTPITEGYTNFPLARAATSDYTVGAAAVLPCYWLYADIGLRLHAANTPEHPNRAWLSTYGDEDFLKGACRAIEIVEKQMEQAGPVARELALRAYVGAAEWEREFFGQTSRLPR